jgi:hypothetical protein
MNTICIPIAPRLSHISVGMHFVHHGEPINMPIWGHPIGEDWNVSRINTIQVQIKYIIAKGGHR